MPGVDTTDLTKLPADPPAPASNPAPFRPYAGLSEKMKNHGEAKKKENLAAMRQRRAEREEREKREREEREQREEEERMERERRKYEAKMLAIMGEIKRRQRQLEEANPATRSTTSTNKALFTDKKGILFFSCTTNKKLETLANLIWPDGTIERLDGDMPDPPFDNPAATGIRYDRLANYPMGKSTNYLGLRKYKNGAFPEFHSISAAKRRLGLCKMGRAFKLQPPPGKSDPNITEPLYDIKAEDEMEVIGRQFVREACREFSRLGVERKEDESYQRALRRIASSSTMLPLGVRKILNPYSSTDESAVKIEDEMWDQMRRWLWHAFDAVCMDALAKHRKAEKDAKEKRAQLDQEPGYEWFLTDPDDIDWEDTMDWTSGNGNTDPGEGPSDPYRFHPFLFDIDERIGTVFNGSPSEEEVERMLAEACVAEREASKKRTAKKKKKASRKGKEKASSDLEDFDAEEDNGE